jgi:hypothetical protein
MQQKMTKAGVPALPVYEVQSMGPEAGQLRNELSEQYRQNLANANTSDVTGISRRLSLARKS